MLVGGRGGGRAEAVATEAMAATEGREEPLSAAGRPLLLPPPPTVVGTGR